MSSKRGASHQITRENLGREDEEEFDPVVNASQKVLSQRKIAKPKSLRSNASATSTAPAPSASTTAKSNPFGSVFGGNTGSTNGGASEESKPVNPFASIGGSAKTQEPPKQEQTDNKSVQQRALNEKFYEVISDLHNNNNSADWSSTLNKYIEYASKIKSGTLEGGSVGSGSVSTTSVAADKPLFGSSSNTASTPKPFTFGAAPAASEAPKPFAFGSSGETAPPTKSFSFGSGNKENGEENKSEPQSQPIKPFTFGASGNGGSNSEQPKPFTFGAPSTTTATTASSFGSSTQASEATPSNSKPAFSFGSASTANTSPSSSFMAGKSLFGGSETKKEEPPASSGKAEESDAKTGSSSGPVFKLDKPPTMSDSPFTFSSSNDSKSTSDQQKTGFKFEGTLSKEENVFKFSDKESGNNNSEKETDPTSAPAGKQTPAASGGSVFGGSNNTWTPDKGIKFGDASSSKFSFGQPQENKPSGTGLFGSKPGGSSLFGNNSSSGGFTFSPAPAPAAATAAAPDAAGDAENGAEGEDGDAAAAADSQDLSGKGPGEEDESVEYEQKAKLFKLVDGKFAVQGLGQLRVLTHHETKKTRALIRVEGSGRVILNIAIRKEIEYKIEGKNQVRLVDFDVETKKPVTYLVRVKTGDDAQRLQKVLESEKNK